MAPHPPFHLLSLPDMHRRRLSLLLNCGEDALSLVLELLRQAGQVTGVLLLPPAPGFVHLPQLFLVQLPEEIRMPHPLFSLCGCHREG